MDATADDARSGRMDATADDAKAGRMDTPDTLANAVEGPSRHGDETDGGASRAHGAHPCRGADERRERVLVSACLLGEPCRYDAQVLPCSAVMALAQDLDLVPVCPEQLGGLPTPRTPSEIQLDGRVTDRAGQNRTAAFEAGARAAVALARQQGCARAILKSRSPSCGVNEVYDGTFTGTLIPGRGIAAQALANAGLSLCDELSLGAE